MSEHSEIQIIQADIKTLIQKVASLATVNDMQLVEMRVITEDLKRFRSNCQVRHKELNGDLAELEDKIVRADERHQFTWRVTIGVATFLGLMALIYEAWLK